MKKTLLLAIAVGLGATVSAQNARLTRMVKNHAKNLVNKVNEQSVDQNAQLAPYKPADQTAKTSSTCIDAGHSGNLLGYYLDMPSHLWANPKSGLVGHIHRSDMGSGGDANTGFLRASYSKDFGATWTQDEGPAFANDAGNGAQGATFSVARYPQTAMIYPSKGTAAESNPDSTYFVFTSAVRDNSNPGAGGGDWGAHGYGVYKPGGVQKTQHQISSSATYTRRFVIADDFCSTQTNETWTLEIGSNQSKPLGAIYEDTLYLDHGKWNPLTYDVDVVTEKLYAPVGHRPGDNDLIRDAHIAFAPNGLDGWISYLGHTTNYAAPHADSLYYPILHHTTDGGVTWSAQIEVDLSNIAGLTKNSSDSLYFNAVTNPTYRHCTQYNHDLAVDYLGRPHIIVAMGVIDYDPINDGWGTTRGAAVTTITADVTGTNWTGSFLAWPMGYWGCYGDCGTTPLGANYYYGYRRAQIATTWDHKNMIYAWADQDTIQFPPFNNDYVWNLNNPDIWVAAHDLVGDGWSKNPSTVAQSLNVSSVAKNITTQTCADAQAAHFNLAHYVFEPLPGLLTFELPLTYQLFDISASGSALAATVVTHQYIKSGYIAVGINEEAKANKTALNIFPNPTNGNININYSLITSAAVSMDLYNMLGEKVTAITNSASQAPGKHLFTIDMSGYSAGVYFIKANINGAITTTKVVKN